MSSIPLIIIQKIKKKNHYPKKRKSNLYVLFVKFLKFVLISESQIYIM